MKKIFALLFCCLFTFTACGNTAPKSFFRNVDFGMTMDEVKSSEGDKTYYGNERRLSYTEMTVFGVKNSAVEYYFNENKLSTIHVYYYYEDISEGQSDFEIIKKAMAETYGEYEPNVLAYLEEYKNDVFWIYTYNDIKYLITLTISVPKEKNEKLRIRIIISEVEDIET